MTCYFTRKDITTVLIMGVLGAALFLFAFPGLAIPTLMHEVLKLPGPGIGFGFILGPYVIACSLIAYTLTEKRGSMVTTAIILSITLSTLVSTLDLQTPAPGNFVSIEFTAGLFTLGLSVEASLYLLRFRGRFRYIISAIIANMVFVLYSMLAIFSKTVPEKYAALTLNKVVVIGLVSMIGAVLFTLLASTISKSLKVKCDQKCADQ